MEKSGRINLLNISNTNVNAEKHISEQAIFSILPWMHMIAAFICGVESRNAQHLKNIKKWAKGEVSENKLITMLS